MKSALDSRFGVLVLGWATHVLVATLLRAGLLVFTWGEIGFHPLTIFAAFAVGFLYDTVAFAYASIPVVLWVVVAPATWWKSRVHRWLATGLWGVWCYLLFLSAVTEWTFWDEFGARFNFIAVDYLVYTKEVTGNIRESYPMGVILPAILVPAAALFLASRRGLLRSLDSTARPAVRVKVGAAVLAIPVLAWFTLDDSLADISGNRYANELARDGTYSLFNAFWKNRLDYDAYYATRPIDATVARLRALVGRDGATYAKPGGDDLLRHVTGAGPEQRLNVVIITVESLSADFMKAFGEPRGSRGITPRLDALARESLFFRDYYATGVRTVRGLEAIVLSVPPTPGQSVVKRPDNGGMFSIGQVFRARGYDATFLYGGYGAFDNMNTFFGGNGFRCVDRSDLSDDEFTFGNVWGVCDEDMLRRTLVECDRSHAAGRPFLTFTMTTSNHQPFTYPEGRIDIPSGDGRNGAVKYTDYAIGKFLDEARKRPWFDDTIFVIGADHCDKARGRTDLPVEKFHIPLLIWSPKHVAPREVAGVCSQIDLAPTILGLLGWSYDSKFFGQDVLAHPAGRAFVCNYLSIGLYDGTRLVTLATRKSVRIDEVGNGDHAPRAVPPDMASEGMQEDAIAWFQGAAHILDARRHTALAPPTAHHTR